jgi:soluble lytic murein transglycosylase
LRYCSHNVLISTNNLNAVDDFMPKPPKTNKIPIFTVTIIALCCSTISLALSPQQSHYEKAVTAFTKKDIAEFERHTNHLKKYKLYPYIEYYRVNQMTLANQSKIDAFLGKYKSYPVANHLKGKWLRFLNKNKLYTKAAQYSAPKFAITSRCIILAAKIKTGLEVEYLPDKDLWLHGASRPNECDPVFKYWRETGRIGPNAYGLRAKLALELGNIKFGAKLAEKSTAAIQTLVHQHRQKRKAISAAKSYKSNALSLLAAVPSAVSDDEVRKWQARQHIFKANWRSLNNTINAMPFKQKSEDQWQYWQARALARLGKRKQAIAKYKKVAKSSNYYGFLSADRLSLPYAICPKNIKVDQAKFLARFPEISRAIDLHKVGSSYFAGIEWNAAIRRMANKTDKIKASVLVAQLGWYDKSIVELGKLKEYRYYNTRFPIKWRNLVQRQARLRGLPEEFVYGLMRTESAMRPNAKSPAGALGLMQVMPATARRVASRYKLGKNTRAKMLTPSHSVALGTAYLHQMGQKWNKQLILMIASYNAGPHNAAKWVKKLPKEADRFVETIPFDETNKYVTRVLDYTTMYNWLLKPNNVKRIGYRISNIGSKSAYIKSRPKVAKIMCNAS